MADNYSAAPWSTKLKITSAISTLMLPVLAVVAFRAIPAQGGFTYYFGLLIAATLPALLLVSMLFVVTGFTIDGGRVLRVRRLLWSTVIPLSGLNRAHHDPAACERSLKVFGNGGVYSFTGIFKNKTLGRYRIFGTDLSRAVVLSFKDRTVVITPASPGAFLGSLRLSDPLPRFPD